jgi:hypothetical protein
LLAKAPAVDGKAEEWPTSLFVTIDTRRLQIGDWGSKKVHTDAALAVAGDRLYACFKTAEPNLLENSGETWPMYFKTGGALDLMLATGTKANANRAAATAGDVRLLVTLVKKKPSRCFVLWRPVMPLFPFSSPLRTKVRPVRRRSSDGGRQLHANRTKWRRLRVLDFRWRAGESDRRRGDPNDIGPARQRHRDVSAVTGATNQPRSTTCERGGVPKLWGCVQGVRWQGAVNRLRDTRFEDDTN